ncbi:TRAP transporter large permease subunit [Desulfobacula sp.]|uniref:TRAP transporter large permease n=1 Tax=Desulfobacula sp. TaxID=2593537 RepID=UPI0026369A90|nr:TRAP transporter large permease subunit [Desulfobacula sp.]
MSITIITILLLACMFTLLALGVPISFALGGVSAIFAVFFWGFDHLYILASAAYGNLQDLNLAAIPLFIMMGWVLQLSGIADDLFETMSVWLGNIRGGLAMGVILVATLFAAICGELVAAIFTISTIAIPPMIKRGYDKVLTVGCVMAGALLGLIIPPSIEVIVYCSMTGESIGRMYLGTFLPGLLLATLYIIYIAIRCHMNPELGPAIDRKITWKDRFMSLKGVVAPVILLLVIIGGIYSGTITPMEASSVGATGAFICAIIYRRFNLKMLKESMFMTMKVSTMIAWLLIGVGTFSAVYNGIGALDMAKDICQAIPGGGWSVILLTQVALIFFGMFLDDFAVIMIFAPIFVTAVKSLGFDPLWYGVLFMINMQLSFLTPPYGFALFCMRAAVPKGIDLSMKEIYRAALPFILIQLFCLILVMLFKPIATWLPHLLIR